MMSALGGIVELLDTGFFRRISLSRLSNGSAPVALPHLSHLGGFVMHGSISGFHPSESSNWRAAQIVH